jgi:hypothetical protein
MHAASIRSARGTRDTRPVAFAAGALVALTLIALSWGQALPSEAGAWRGNAGATSPASQGVGLR